ncbi:MAG: hypothetical protein E6R04_04475 [Spirochaetes bacterium]|nr:MAG: hypothetical protein E6R04_04475 [Spirochaetota bacterium]
MANNDSLHVANPFNKGDAVTIPAGTVISSTHPQRRWSVSKRAQTITVHHTIDTYVSVELHGNRGMVKFGTVTWPGAGGYWRDVQVTPELLAANGMELPELPGQDGTIRGYHLDVIPSFDEGYTNRWNAPQES